MFTPVALPGTWTALPCKWTMGEWTVGREDKNVTKTVMTTSATVKGKNSAQ